MQENLKAGSKLLLLVLWMGLCYIITWLAFKLGKIHFRDRMVKLCNTGILRVMGITLTVTGQLTDKCPLLLVTNHVSYLDIPVIASQANIRFTPKIEIARWPVFGSIARLCSCIFIDRRPDKVMEMQHKLHSSLDKGEVICLFPESTTGDGLHRHPFKSGLFSLAEPSAEGREIYIQPAAIAYTHLRRLPIDSTQWPMIAWYGDMELVSHLWNFLKLGPLQAQLIFLAPVTVATHGGRKKLAAHCQEVIEDAIQSTRGTPVTTHRKNLFNPRFLRLKS